MPGTLKITRIGILSPDGDTTIFPLQNERNKSREARLRRQAKRLGLCVTKSRQRSTHSNNHGGYMLTAIVTNCIIAGASFDLNLENLETVLDRVSGGNG